MNHIPTKTSTWFFDDFLGTTKRLDYKVVALDGKRLLVKNNGEMVSPVIITGMTGDSICFEKWEEGFKGEKWIDVPADGYSEIRINPNHVMPEINYLNNNIKKTGLFRKADPLNPQLLFSVEDPDKRSIMYVPSFNWDSQDGFMAGISVNNGFLLPKPFEYNVMPFVSFKNGGLTGYGKIAYNITPYNNLIRLATISLEGTQLGAPGNQSFQMTKTGLEINFRNRKMINGVSQKVYTNFITTSDLFQLEKIENVKTSLFYQVGYIFERSGIINPFKVTTALEMGNSFQKSSVEFNYKYSYRGKKNGLNMRLFAGAMLKNSTAIAAYNLSPGGRTGREEYLLQGDYPDRFTVFPANFWSRQMTLSEGGIITPVNDSIGFSRWLVSATFDSSLPGKAGRIPIKPFINILLNDKGLNAVRPSPFFFEAGFKFGLLNFMEIYFPFVVSDNIRSIEGSVKNRIRFTFDLDALYNLRLNSDPGN